ncbi:hypothetical protein [Virgibacillus pantothenticus]|uniref:Uncharacterized protein n=1 Tax=Virgibacillus pantothenticus TaxID=1473 RepID=A0A0L0QM51_VIRPA|nr:hypothetical protein [Virgibacillus pantothenticus]KNE19695.1 hypothetical protein AFK71_14705 [Virgibacillus pantothenticus]MEB5453999.1 hypothetical protein [Virgibacillus pantothenticus]MEB5458297.1 hypothetical protein [Virgibacillus pantothenticus]MEB5462452.1 hypothetical protein [Virgibacillus pantothenticus]MEB5466589.1 hypothetical protein [Virgibacillus pantothenticus]
MSKINLSVLFKKMQKDDKKEILEFHVQGDELQHSDELVQLAGNIALLEVKNSEVDRITAEFKTLQRDSKKTVLKFNVKGDSEIIKLYTLAGSHVDLLLEPSQMSIEEFEDMDPHEGIDYSVNNDGTVEVVEGQVSIDDLPTGEPDEVTFDDPDLSDPDLLLD